MISTITSLCVCSLPVNSYRLSIKGASATSKNLTFSNEKLYHKIKIPYENAIIKHIIHLFVQFARKNTRLNTIWPIGTARLFLMLQDASQSSHSDPDISGAGDDKR